MTVNYYDVLGIEKHVTGSEIKKAYRKLAMEHHPDKGGNEDTFKKINEAYSVLSDTHKRRMHDLGRDIDQVPIDSDEIFRSMFGGSFRPGHVVSDPFNDQDLFMQMGMGGPMFGGGGFTIHTVNIGNEGIHQQTRTVPRMPQQGIPPGFIRMLFRL